jgi:hypothetical protein
MRVGGIISFALHAGFVAAGMIVAPHLASRDATPMIMLPVELLTISDSTNVTAVSESVKEEETPEIAKSEPAASAPPPPPEESIEALPDRSKREEPKATPPKPPEKKKSFLDQVNATLTGVNREYKETPPNSTPTPGGSPDSADDKPRQGAGDAKRMTITVADYIKSQLVRRQCWTSQADMADAPRLRVVFAVSFKRDGKLAGEPKMLEPRSMPTNDMPLQVYIERARTALLKCNQPRYDVPKEYFDFNPPETIELEFRPGK